MRILPLLALALAACLVRAAPAPLPKSERGPEQRPVYLAGAMPDRDRLPAGTRAVASRAGWEHLARTLGIRAAPAVNFRTHFLAVHVAASDLRGGIFWVEDGDLRHGLGRRGEDKVAIRFADLDEPPGYLIQSFPRSAVKTVNGAPLPKR
jgi:hypothetical protein